MSGLVQIEPGIVVRDPRRKSTNFSQSLADIDLAARVRVTIGQLKEQRRKLTANVRLLTRAIRAHEGELALIERDWTRLPKAVIDALNEHE